MTDGARMTRFPGVYPMIEIAKEAPTSERGIAESRISMCLPRR